MTQRLPVALALVALASCQDCDPPLTETRAAPEVTPSVLDMGAVDVAQVSVKSFSIANRGDRTFDELEVLLTPESDPAFSLGKVPAEVGVAQAVNIDVRVRPQLAVQMEGDVKIRGRVAPEGTSPTHAEFTVHLTATGENNGLPSLVVDPPEVDFGLVGLGDVARRTLTIRNAGIRDLIIDEARLLAASTSAFGCSTCPVPYGTSISPGDQVSLDLVFHPDQLPDQEALIHIISNDPNKRELDVKLKGGGLDVPVAVLDLVDDVTNLEPQTVVRVDGGRSSTQRGYLQTYEWSLSYRPAGSSTVLESQGADRARGVDLAVECRDPATVPAGETPCSTRMHVLADLAGTYQVTLVVVTHEGARSAPATVRFRAIPKEELHIQLVWDHPTADLDLHYVRGNGPWFNFDWDCYFSNRFPAWYGEDAQDFRNPRLDVDDRSGFGPENLNVHRPVPGRSLVGVHYWSPKTQGDPSALATVRIYVRGQLAMEQGQFFLDDQQMWHVAELVWPEDPDAAPTINPLGTLQPYPRPF